MKKSKPKISNQARALLLLVLVWEILAIVYVVITQNFFKHKLSAEHSLIIIFIIVAPPMLVMLAKIMMPSSAWLNKVTFETQRQSIVKQMFRSFPLMLQLFSVVFVIFALFESSVFLQRFTQLFLFITFCVAVADSYYRQSHLYGCLFVIFACLYNPFYLIDLPDGLFTLALVATLFLFVIHIMHFVRNNHLTLCESCDAAQAIDSQLQWILQEVPHHHIEFFQNSISRKYPAHCLQKADSIEWHVLNAPDLVFAAMNVFNDEIVIVITGVKRLKGFRAYYVFYNQNFQKMVCLEHKCSYGARLLQEKLVVDHGFYVLKLNYSKLEHITI